MSAQEAPTPSKPSPVDSSQTSRRNLLRWGAGGGAALAGLALAQGIRSHSATAQTPASIVGAWVVTFPSGTPDPNEHDLVAFTADGIVISGGAPSSPPNPDQGSPTRTYTTIGLGSWAALTGGQFKVVFTQVDTDESGNFADIVTIGATVGVAPGGGSFTGTFTIVVKDAGGNVLFNSNGPAGEVTGTRITALP